jgi:endonuclease/exonuclease/phosphatase (EEP) superfamily protein YafD
MKIISRTTSAVSTSGEQIDAAITGGISSNRRKRLVARVCLCYLLSVVFMWLLLRYAGDRSWVGAVITFSPRWIWLVPAPPLLFAIPRYNRRSVLNLLCAVFVAVFPVMGFHIPWRVANSAIDSGPSIRVMTCNVHGLGLHPDLLAESIAALKPDIVLLQEWTPPYDAPIFAGAGWTFVTNGEMCLASRFPVQPYGEIEDTASVRYTVKTPIGNISVINVHFASPHFPLRDTVLGMRSGRIDLQDNIALRQRESRSISDVVRAMNGPVIVAGDFNLCPDSPIFRDNFDSLPDAFARCGFGFGWTYHNRWTASRIDHILTAGGLISRVCWVGDGVGSPHRPLVADLAIERAK